MKLLNLISLVSLVLLNNACNSGGNMNIQSGQTAPLGAPPTSINKPPPTFGAPPVVTNPPPPVTPPISPVKGPIWGSNPPRALPPCTLAMNAAQAKNAVCKTNLSKCEDACASKDCDPTLFETISTGTPGSYPDLCRNQTQACNNSCLTQMSECTAKNDIPVRQACAFKPPTNPVRCQPEGVTTSTTYCSNERSACYSNCYRNQMNFRDYRYAGNESCGIQCGENYTSCMKTTQETYARVYCPIPPVTPIFHPVGPEPIREPASYGRFAGRLE